MFLFHVRQGTAVLDVITGGNMKVLSFVYKVLLSTAVTIGVNGKFLVGFISLCNPLYVYFFYIYYRNLTFYSLKYMELIIGS